MKKLPGLITLLLLTLNAKLVISTVSLKYKEGEKKRFKYNTAVSLCLHDYSVIEQDLTEKRRSSKYNYRH